MMTLLAAVTAVLFGALHFLPKHRRRIFVAAAFIPLALVTARLLYRIFAFPNMTGVLHLAHILQALPLHLCGIAAILLPLYVLTGNKPVFAVLYYFSAIGGLATLLFDNVTSTSIADLEMWSFFIPHIIYFLLPIALVIYGHARPTAAGMAWAWLIILGIVTVMHFVNLTVNAIFGTDEYPIIVNYIFTIFPGDNYAGTNNFEELPILSQAYHLTNGTQYFYLWLLLPILAAIDLIMYIPFYAGNKIRKNRAVREAGRGTADGANKSAAGGRR